VIATKSAVSPVVHFVPFSDRLLRHRTLPKSVVIPSYLFVMAGKEENKRRNLVVNVIVLGCTKSNPSPCKAGLLFLDRKESR
jgi:hypothetical protein